MHRKRAIGPIGSVPILNNTDDIDMAYTLTLLTNLDPSAQYPLAIDLREESNTQFDFLNVIISFVEKGIIKRGDIVIMDNWGGHVADDIMEPLLDLCNEKGFEIKLLPKYSPELNPCELIFGIVKEELRHHRGKEQFWIEILKALSHVTYEIVAKCYYHCICKYPFE